MAPLPTSDSAAVAPEPSATRRAWEGWPGRVLRVLIAALPLYWLFRRLNWREVMREAAAVGPTGIALAFTCVFVSVAVGAVRWGVMLRAYGATDLPPLSTMLRHNLIGLWFNLLPSGVAGDAVRGHRVREYAGGLPTSYTVLFVERVPVLGPMIVKIPPPRSVRGPLASVFLSVLTQGALVVCVFFLLRPLSPVATFGVCARVVPAIILVTYIPITPGGLGQREAAFTGLFGLAGVPGTMAVAASLLFFAEIVGVSVLGGLCLAAERIAAVRGRPWDLPRA